MKIKIYELLGLIKDGKAPKKIKYNGEIMLFKNSYYVYENKDYGIAMWDFNKLNDEIEILEEVEDKEYEDITLLREEYIEEFENMSGEKQQYIIKTLMEIALKKM